MRTSSNDQKNITAYFLILALMLVIALWLRTVEIETGWQKAGLLNLSLGFMLLTAYVGAQILKRTRLPLISGYIFAGIIAGPYVTGFLTFDMVEQFGLIDDLALSFIALTAGGELQMQSLKKRGKVIALNITFQILIIFLIVFAFVVLAGSRFYPTNTMPQTKVIMLAILLGVISVARSPSSTIAIISECRASGPFTETVLGVTIVKDVLIIILFTIAMTVCKIIFSGSGIMDFQALVVLSIEILVSLGIGAVLGKGISLYINRIRHDLLLFLLFIAFGITKTTFWMSGFMENHFNIYLNLEPLLICMSAGFFVQNYSSSGTRFMEALDRMALPIFVLFFTIAGASLNLESLQKCWPIALCIVVVRTVGIFCSTWLAGTLSGDPIKHNNVAWMGYITQAGVAIGLAQLAERQFPQVGSYLITIVLAVITINQIAGPITFKTALTIVDEAGKRK